MRLYGLYNDDMEIIGIISPNLDALRKIRSSDIFYSDKECPNVDVFKQYSFEYDDDADWLPYDAELRRWCYNLEGSYYMDEYPKEFYENGELNLDKLNRYPIGDLITTYKEGNIVKQEFIKYK
jgi:hypothetical protein